MEDLESAFLWICELRKDYSPNSDIWDLRRNWNNIKHLMREQLNDGTYQFSVLDRYVFDDATLSLWSSKDMIALKLIAQALETLIKNDIPKSCYHLKGHGGLKKAVQHTHQALSQFQFVLRSDVKNFYESVNFNILISIIETYVKHPILIKLIIKACRRTETYGGNFYEFFEKGIPMGSPLSPLLGAIALIPLDLAMKKFQGVFYARFMDDWIVLTKSKTALRKVVKMTHRVLNNLKFQMHPTKTYIGKISHGFNFLAYFMDDQKILPSTETIRRFSERASVLYENSQLSRRYKKNIPYRDISMYQANESAPDDTYVHSILSTLREKAVLKPEFMARLRRYLAKWANWIKSGLSEIIECEQAIREHLPTLWACMVPCNIAGTVLNPRHTKFY